MSLISGPIMALQNLTRIYVIDLPFDEERFGKSTTFFPLIGLVIGAFLSAVFLVGSKYFPPTVVGALLLTSYLIVTGGLHLDGFMDSMDGLFSGRDRDRKLEIMKDSRVGANGVMGALVLLILKYSLFSYLATFNSYAVITILIATTTMSRWTMVYTIRFFPYIRKEGLGSLYKQYTGNKEFYIGTILTLIILLLMLQVKFILVFALIWLLTYFMARQISTTIGGMTGDTYGALTEISEVLVLLIILAIV